MELEAIAAAVIGGTAMRGGVGSIFGTFVGAFIMAEVPLFAGLGAGCRMVRNIGDQNRAQPAEDLDGMT